MATFEPERTVEVDIGCLPEAAVPGPVIFQSERSAYLVFNATRKTSDGRREDAGTAVVELPNCLMMRLGHPNDEGMMKYPFYKGLAYSVHEVLNSIWVRQLMEFRQARFPNPNPEWWGLEGRHFIFGFHDSTFECISGAPKASTTTESRTSVHRRLLARIEEE